MSVHRFVLACVKRYVARHGHRLVQADGKLSDLFVSLGEARNLAGPRDTPPARTAERAGWPSLEEAEAEVGREAAALQARDPSSRLERLLLLFGLDELDVQVLAAAAAPFESVDLGRLYTFALADFTIRRPTVGFIAELVAATPADAPRVAQRLRDEAPLVRHRLVRVDAQAGWGMDPPRLGAVVSVPSRVLDFLAGVDTPLPAHLTAAASFEPPTWPPREELLVAPETGKAIAAALWRAVEAPDGRPRLVLVGGRGIGRRTIVGTLLAHQFGMPLLTVELARLPDEPAAFAERLAELAREAVLARAALLVRADDWFEGTERTSRFGPALARLLREHRGVVVITSERAAGPLHALADGLFEIALPTLRPEEQRRAWTRALAYVGPEPLEDRLVDRFNLTPGLIHRAVREARATVAQGDDGALTANAVIHAVRRQADHALSEIAEPFTTSLTWDDVVLPNEVSDAIIDILNHARYRAQVFDDWGFRRKMAYGRGLSCLFSGPPGTGKTMVASVLAQALERELYRVDLSRVTSKWVGETEKNLARVFDEAERAQVILLFDEADSLFSSRTDVKSANDRFANNEINYLLQRMEAYDGMTILTTNLDAAMDEAFRRRIKFRIAFQMPDANQRTLLWQSMIPSAAPLAADVAFAELGRRFELAGGGIKNAVLRAAFYAAEDRSPISFEHLTRAARAEAEEMGRLVGDSGA